MRRLKLYKNKGFIPLETKKSREKSRFLTGFTLVETLVAITVLTLALGGPMTLATRSIKDSLASRNKVVAFYLAHEAIEYVKNTRDSNFLERISGGSNPWLQGLSVCSSSVNGCRIDVVNDSVSGCGSPCEVLRFDSISRVYSYNSGGDSIFTRKITIDDSLNGGDEAKVIVTVEWTDYGLRNVTLTQNMFNLAP